MFFNNDLIKLLDKFTQYAKKMKELAEVKK